LALSIIADIDNLYAASLENDPLLKEIKNPHLVKRPKEFTSLK